MLPNRWLIFFMEFQNNPLNQRASWLLLPCIVGCCMAGTTKCLYMSSSSSSLISTLKVSVPLLYVPTARTRWLTHCHKTPKRLMLWSEEEGCFSSMFNNAVCSASNFSEVKCTSNSGLGVSDALLTTLPASSKLSNTTSVEDLADRFKIN